MAQDSDGPTDEELARNLEEAIDGFNKSIDDALGDLFPELGKIVESSLEIIKGPSETAPYENDPWSCPGCSSRVVSEEWHSPDAIAIMNVNLADPESISRYQLDQSDFFTKGTIYYGSFCANCGAQLSREDEMRVYNEVEKPTKEEE